VYERLHAPTFVLLFLEFVDLDALHGVLFLDVGQLEQLVVQLRLLLLESL